MNDIDTKLSAARTKLILDKPFLGALVLRLPLIEADPGWCKTTATDARALYYNADYIDRLTLDQMQFALAHEALHCALSHFARRQHRDRHRWDLACDFAINPLLVEEGLTPVQDALLLNEFKGMTAEEIYPCLDEAESLHPHDDHLYDQESGAEGGSAGSGGDRGEGGAGNASRERAQRSALGGVLAHAFCNVGQRLGREHVEVADGTERAGEPLELLRHRLQRRRSIDAGDELQASAKTPRADAHLMHPLRIAISEHA